MARYISTIGFRPPAQPSILIATDDAEGARGVTAALHAASFRTRCAPSSRLERMIEAEVPDLVIADGPHAVATCEAVVRIRPPVPVIASVDTDAARLAAVQAGADHVMSRPIATDELVARARWLVEQRTRQAAAVSKLDTMKMWQDWVRYLVHDLRNPVTIALGSVSFARELNEDETLDRHLATSERALEEVAAMMRDVLDTDRIKHGALVPQKEEIDLVELATMMAGRVSNGRQIDVSGDGDTKIIADRLLIGRVFSNLMLNAARHARERPVTVEVVGTSHGVSARVINDGPGIAPELEPHLFEPWRNLGGSATGIGLAFCRLVCEAHDGKIWLEDATTGKVTFAFGIPRAPLARRSAP